MSAARRDRFVRVWLLLAVVCFLIGVDATLLLVTREAPRSREQVAPDAPHVEMTGWPIAYARVTNQASGRSSVFDIRWLLLDIVLLGGVTGHFLYLLARGLHTFPRLTLVDLFQVTLHAAAIFALVRLSGDSDFFLAVIGFLLVASVWSSLVLALPSLVLSKFIQSPRSPDRPGRAFARPRWDALDQAEREEPLCDDPLPK